MKRLLFIIVLLARFIYMHTEKENAIRFAIFWQARNSCDADWLAHYSCSIPISFRFLFRFCCRFCSCVSELVDGFCEWKGEHSIDTRSERIFVHFRCRCAACHFHSPPTSCVPTTSNEDKHNFVRSFCCHRIFFRTWNVWKCQRSVSITQTSKRAGGRVERRRCHAFDLCVCAVVDWRK